MEKFYCFDDMVDFLNDVDNFVMDNLPAASFEQLDEFFFETVAKVLRADENTMEAFKNYDPFYKAFLQINFGDGMEDLLEFIEQETTPAYDWASVWAVAAISENACIWNYERRLAKAEQEMLKKRG